MSRIACIVALLVLAGAPAVGRVARPKPLKGRAAKVQRLQELRQAQAVLDGLIPEQRAAVDDPCRYKALWTTRRAGKTTTIVHDFIARGLKRPRTKFIYIALTLESARDLAWTIIEELDEKHSLGLRLQEAKLRAIFPNGSEIKLLGADRPGTGKKIYGRKLGGLSIDEAAFYSIDIEDLIKDYVGAALTDLQGVCWLMSIPGHLPRGLFFHLTSQFPMDSIFEARCPESTPECLTASRWSVHTWSYQQNPYTRVQVQQELDEELEHNPEALKDPRIIRNYLKGWPLDTSKLVYKYDRQRNVLQGDWDLAGYRFGIGLDLGWKDHVALSVLAYQPDHPEILVVETWRVRETLMDAVAEKIRELIVKYPGCDIVCDPAHLYTFEQLRRGYSLPLMEAEKAKKYQAIQLFNSGMLAGHIKVLDPDPRTNPLVDEWTSLCWKVMADGTKKETPGQANDLCDATLTAWRHVHHYTSGEVLPQQELSAEERARQEEQDLIAALAAEHEAEHSGEWNDW